MATKATPAAVAAGVTLGEVSFAQPVVDRDGLVYTDKGQPTDWRFVAWPDQLSPKSLPAAMHVVDGTVRGVLAGANVVLTTRNGGYILQVQHEGLETEINLGWEISRLVVAEQASPRGRDDWQRDFTGRLQAMLKDANK